MINYSLFNSYPFSLRQSLGSIIELTPIAVIGCIFSSSKILQYKNIFIIIIILLIIISSSLKVENISLNIYTSSISLRNTFLY